MGACLPRQQGEAGGRAEGAEGGDGQGLVGVAAAFKQAGDAGPGEHPR